MTDRRRRNPEPSGKRRQEARRWEDDEQQQRGMRASPESIYSSSSSSHEYIDISHSFPPNKSGIKTFFTAPSERRLRRRRSSRLMRHGNSSSESVADLAYGHGYLRRPKRKVRSRKGKEIDRERYSERERERDRYTERSTERYSDGEREKSGIGRATTDAEILAVGAGLAKLAREQNKLDLKSAPRAGKQGFPPPQEFGRDGGTNQGLGHSKVSYGPDVVDEDGWESASDAESESSVDSRLAFGAESSSGWNFFGRKTYKPQSRKDSVVDPRLFGPANSLHGIVTQPVGFGEVAWTSSSDFGQHPYTVPPAESVASGSQPSMHHVYPIATDDSTRYEVGRSSVAYGAEPYMSSRPGPIPIQQPQPMTPVSQSVYDPPIYSNRSETGTGILKKTPSSSGRGKSLAEAALFGVAGAAVGAAIASEQKDDRKERRRDDDREDDRIPKRRDSERKDTKDDRKRDKHSPDRDDRKEKRRDKDRNKDSDDRKDKKREKRRDDGREEARDERRERRREERRSERDDDRYETRRTKSDTAVSQVSVDPFQYQVDNDAFATRNNEPETGHGRVESVPTVVTVEREPNFSRKRSSSIKDQFVSARSEPDRGNYAGYDERDQRNRDRDSHRDSTDRPLHEAESIYEQAERFTAPIDAAAISAPIAAEGYRESRSERRRGERRGERRSDYDNYDYKARDKESKRDSKDYDEYDRKTRERESTRESKARDPVQEEADRAYREIVMARKIASQVIRSRSPSPNRSVTDKYPPKDEEEKIIRIVTPPGMEDKKKKGLYDAPNADFKLDYVLKHPQEIRRFSLPSADYDRFDPDGPYLTKDDDASQPRPLLNLVLPTPTPSPMPEKQVARSEPANPSKPKVETPIAVASDVVIGPKGTVVQSPSASAFSKGVTWGENETKHFEVESPSEHRDEFVSSPELQAHDDPAEQPRTRSCDSPAEQTKPSNGTKRSGWGAIAAGIIGASAGAAAASASETSKTSESSKIKGNEKTQDAPYEYRGVVAEPESPPRSKRPRSPPTTGPKPTSSQTTQFSTIPGAFGEDLDFTATVAAGLQDTGFDPNIVINDPGFRRRDSPPGSNGPGLYHAPYAETVSDLSSVLRGAPSTRDGQGFVIGEVANAPKGWPVISPDEDDSPSKLSRKEQKKREKAKRQSGDFTPVEESSQAKEDVAELEYFKLSKKEQKKRDKDARRQSSQAEDVMPFDDPSVAGEIVEEPESDFDESKRKKKSKKGSSNYDDPEAASRDSRKVSVPVDAFDDLRNGEDEWSETKRSKKSKDKSKRKSDSFEPDLTEVNLPPSTPSKNNRDGALDDLRRKGNSSSKDSADRGESRSVVSEDASRYEDDEPRKSKRKSKSRDDFDDTRSVVSAPAGDDYDDKKSKKKDKDKKSGGGFFGLFGSKSEVGAQDDSPKRSKDDFEDVKRKSKKSKRNSMPNSSGLDGDMGSQAIGDLSRITSNENGNGNGTYYDDQDLRDEKNSRTRDEIESSQRDSFLAKAGTLGAGVGLAGAAVAISAQRHQQSNADNAHESNQTAEQTHSRGSSQSTQLEEILDPEITQRQFRPSIDPQYGDLLPLPPSDPVSPNVEPIDDLPDLPNSRPDTPEAERLAREKSMALARKAMHETPMKSPSHSAVPLKFMMGNRSNPSSPGTVRAPPLQSPAAATQDSLQFPRSRSRPTSWDNTKEFQPLYLVESNNRRGSNVLQQEVEEQLPALPPSQRTSRSSSQLDSSDEATFEDAVQYPKDIQVRFAEPLSIDTGLAKTSIELLDSQQSTPKATGLQYLDLDHGDGSLPEHKSIDPSESPTLPAYRSVSPETKEHHDSHAKTAAEIIAGAALVSSIGYFASSPVQRPTDKHFLDELPSHSEVQRQASPVDPMSKERSSYLLQSSPMSKKTENDEVVSYVDDSPTSRQMPQSEQDSLHTIQERDANDVFKESTAVQPTIELERKRTLETLSGSAHDEIAAQEESRVFDDERIVAEPLRELPSTELKEEAELADEFVFTKSKKDRKKDKKKGKGLSRTSTQDDDTTQLELTQESVEEPPVAAEVEPAEEFSLPKSKKDKKKGKGISRSSTQDDFSFQESSLEIYERPSTYADVEPAEEISVPKSKKDKKKAKKLSRTSTQDDFSFEEPRGEVTEESGTNPNVDPIEELSLSTSKKGKKKDKKTRKSVTSWEPEGEASSSAPTEEPAHETSQDMLKDMAAPAAVGALGLAAYAAFKQPEDLSSPTQHEKEWHVPESTEQKPVGVFDFQDEEPSASPQDQPPLPIEFREEAQSSEITQHILPEADRDIPQESPTFDDFATTVSKKNQKNKGRKSQSWTIEETLPSESVPESVEPPVDMIESRQLPEPILEEQRADESDQFVTPGWSSTAATPWATANEEAPKSSSRGYFPSAAALHSPAKPPTQDEVKSRGYFPSAAAILPVTAAGVAIVAADHLDKNADENVLSEASTSQDLESEPSRLNEPDTDSSQIIPDGLKTGYNNDQLSLARQLQEEFSSGIQKSKKDKKKRQSLPATADVDFSRSRDPNEDLGDRHRARSLSIGQKHGTGMLVNRPISEDRKNVYSEDQLELARQLKAEFEGGNKKSKKDKKKRQSLSQTSTQDAAAFETPAEEPQSMEPGIVEDFTVRPPVDSTRDGFEAGYQEDQLSLARQLQAEFGSGSKKSKNDKKRRSKSQTPTQEPESQTDYFDNTSQPPLTETLRDLDTHDVPDPAAIGADTVRDGLAVGYNEDQLELARQLKEDFSSGSKKSKKDKKKRQSLLRNTTEDDFSSDYIPRDGSESRNPQITDSVEAEPIEPIIAEPEDEFAFSTKKSKKDKKGKKRESLIPATNDDEVPSEIAVEDLDESATIETFQPAAVKAEPDEPPAENPDDEFSLTRKKSKKDKKGKKRDSILPSSTDDTPPSDDFGKAVEALHGRNFPSEEAAPSEEVSSLFEDDRTATTKKSKKDKKKRQSLASQDGFWDQPAAEAEPEQFGASEDPSTADATAMGSAEVISAPADELGFSTKKSKKDKKKRQSLLRSSTSDGTPEQQLSSISNEDIEESLSAQQDPPVQEHHDERNEPVVETTHLDTVSHEPILENTPFEQEEAVKDEPEAQFEQFAFTTKKSKKDKKNRRSSAVPVSDGPSGVSTPLDPIQETPSTTRRTSLATGDALEKPADIVQPTTRDIGESVAEGHIAEEALADPADEWSSFSTGKSKKDKKKRKSGISTPVEETPLEPEIIAPKELGGFEESTDIPEQVADSVDEEWGSFATKKSKRDKNNRKSSLSTPFQETLPKPETTDQRGLAEGYELQLSVKAEAWVDDELGSFATKKSTKEKRESNSGLFTPLETLIEPEPTPQTGGEELRSQVEEQSLKHEFSSQQEAPKTDEFAQQPGEPAEKEWDVLTTKTSKKQQKKNKSGLLTPLETSAELKSSTAQSNLPQAEEPKSQLEELIAGGVFTTKKSKKGKKKKSGPSTPLEAALEPESTFQETQRTVEEPEIQTLLEPESITQWEPQDSGGPQAEEAVDDEWGFSTTKNSKKGKKSKSGVSTPLEDVTQPDTTYQEDPAMDESAPAQAEDAGEDEWDSFTTKKSKKDKRRKSGLSTPVEETILPQAASQPEQVNADEVEPQQADETRDMLSSFTVKPSKKDKKKQKSGLSTAIEETLPSLEPEQSLLGLASDELLMQSQSLERDVSAVGFGLDNSQFSSPETADDGFNFSTKKSKKGKRASRVDSESNPSASATPYPPVPPPETGAEDEARLVSERFTQSPVPFEKDFTERTIEADPRSTIQREILVEARVDENDESPHDLGRKPSKKDKRKRQATADTSKNEDPGATTAPLTSWADQVGEAQVERETPVIEDIAKDKSLSHIASTTEAAPVDDFSRPQKKGKKGKKRNSLLTRESSMNEASGPPILEDEPEKRSEEHSDVPILAATGAARAGATYLTGKPEEEKTEPPPSTAFIKEVDLPSPPRKLSKKEKRKQSIDRRVPNDGLFDDPALWEGAEPRAYEEFREGIDDGGSDGFWSAPNPDEDVPLEESLPAHEAPHPGPVKLSSPHRNEPTLEPVHDRETENQRIQSALPRDLPRPEQQWNDLPGEYITAPSRKDKKKKKQSRQSAWDTPQEQEKPIEVEQPIGHSPVEPPRAIFEEPYGEQHAPFEQRPATPPNEFVEESPTDRDLSFQDDQFRPQSSLQYSHQGAPSLAIVREESPAQVETEHFERPSYPRGADDFNRDSAFVTDSPVPGQRSSFADEHIRDSGVHLREASPSERAVPPVSNSDDAIARLSWPSVDETTETVDLHRAQRPKVDITAKHHEEGEIVADAHRSHQSQEQKRDFHLLQTVDEERPHRYHEEGQDLHSSPLHTEESFTNLHRTKTIHRSHAPEEERHRHHEEGRDSLPSQLHKEESFTDLHRTKTIHRSQKSESLVKQRVQRIESPDFQRSQTSKEGKYSDLSSAQRPKAEKPRTASDNTIETAAAIGATGVGFAAARQLSREKRPESAQSQRSSSNINRLRTPDPQSRRPKSVGSNRSSGTPPLRRSDRKSGDLRSLSQRSNVDLAKEAEAAAIAAGASVALTSALPANPQANEGRVRAKEMADVYDGFGEGRMGSPRSPTRPHSMRRRQSMQVLDLEQRLEQLAAENRALAEAKSQADRVLQTTQHASSTLVERDAELDSLKRTLAWLQNEVTRLTEVNDGLTSANITFGNQQNDRYNSLESQHAQATRELQEVRDSHNNLSQGMEGIVNNEVQNAVKDKDREIAELRAQLESVKEQVREMQRQILESKAGDSEFLTIRDEDYFDNACQQLCQHVQQWVLRFSKFSDMRACRLTSEINNDKIIDRLDNAILDGSDVDSYLADRVKRRDVFMSMTMTMVWEFVFTRYLFGMDREQRQKLKSLEKLLSEVGPASAVHQWRATTLTLLSKREAFVQQREQDTLAVVNAVLETLTEILPTPSHLEQQIQEQLTRVMKAAVDLSIEMRTQRAEYMMLPPLQPEYDANGDLASKVSFNAALMNERSGDTASNEELEAQKAVVRIVLFPLVVKKGDDSGEGEDEIVVCPAQVLVAKPKKQVRIFSNGSQPNQSRISMQSSMPADYGGGGTI